MPGEPLPPILGVARHECVTTDLYYNHSKTKDVRFPRDRTSSLENFWRGPCHRISVFLCCGVHSANNRSKLEIG